LGVAGCKQAEDGTGTTDNGDVTKGGTFSYYISEPAFIDPVNLQESEGTQVGQAIFDSLVAFDPVTSEIVPAAAESWEPNEDATVWTFNLREGAKFHNGRDVTAQDFKYAWERICNPANESEIYYHLASVVGYDEMQSETASELAGVKVIDETTLEVTLKEAFADFEYVVGHPALAPVPQEEVEKDPAAWADMPIGNGPFQMVSPWAHDQGIQVERFEDYYGTAPNIDGIDFKILADEDTAWLEFQAGNIDFTTIPSGQIGSTVEEYGESPDGYTVNPGEQTSLGTELAVYYLVVNNADPIMKDQEVREAISLAINRQAICDKIFEGTRVPATGIVPEGIVGFQDNAWASADYDVEAAKALLEGKTIPKINLEFNSGSGHEDIIQLVQADLKAVGIDSELVGTEWAAYLDKLDARNYSIGRLGWLADYPIMDNFLFPLFTTGSGDNKSGYSNAEVDSKLAEARTTTDSDARVGLYQDVEKTIGETTPVIPLMFYRHHHVASERVNDGVYSPNGLFTFETVWLEDAAETEE
jgi:peptide/nickel transport system substrate-binding protein/oligopeptide transport system substrate-binding protein